MTGRSFLCSTYLAASKRKLSSLSSPSSRAMNLSPNATIAALVSKDSLFISVSLLEDSNVDAVYCPIPTSLHVERAVHAARKGKHILIDKPVALNVSEFDQFVSACEIHRFQFMDGTQWMHNPRIAKVKEFVNDLEKFG